MHPGARNKSGAGSTGIDTAVRRHTVTRAHRLTGTQALAQAYIPVTRSFSICGRSRRAKVTLPWLVDTVRLYASPAIAQVSPWSEENACVCIYTIGLHMSASQQGRRYTVTLSTPEWVRG